MKNFTINSASVSSFIALILLMLFQNQVYAEQKNILFLDVNDNPEEIEAVEKVAQKHQYNLETMYSPQEKLNVSEAVEKIKKLQNYPIHVLILSGHHGSEFYGNNGSFKYSELDKIFSVDEEAKKAFEHIETIFLLGCHSGSSSLLLQWKKRLPNLKVVLGYEAQAPLGNKREGHVFLDYFITHLSKILMGTLTDGTLDAQTKAIFNNYNYDQFDPSNGPGMGLFFKNKKEQVSETAEEVEDEDAYIKNLTGMFYMMRTSGDNLSSSYILPNITEYCSKKMDILASKYAGYFSQISAMRIVTPSIQSKDFWGKFHHDYSNDKICLDNLVGIIEDENDDENLYEDDNDDDYGDEIIDKRNVKKQFDEKLKSAFAAKKIEDLVQQAIKSFRDENFKSQLFLLKYYSNLRKNYFKELERVSKFVTLNQQPTSLLNAYNKQLQDISNVNTLKSIAKKNFDFLELERPKIEKIISLRKIISEVSSPSDAVAKAKRELKTIFISTYREANQYVSNLINSIFEEDGLLSEQQVTQKCIELLDITLKNNGDNNKTLTSEIFNKTSDCIKIFELKDVVSSMKNYDLLQDNIENVVTKFQAQSLFYKNVSVGTGISNLQKKLNELKLPSTDAAQEAISLKVAEKSFNETLKNNFLIKDLENIKNDSEAGQEILMDFLGSYGIINQFNKSFLVDIDASDIPFTWHEPNPTHDFRRYLENFIHIADKMFADKKFYELMKRTQLYRITTDEAQ